MWIITASLAVQSAQIMKTTLRFNALALSQRAATSDFLPLVKIFTLLLVILPPAGSGLALSRLTATEAAPFL